MRRTWIVLGVAGLVTMTVGAQSTGFAGTDRIPAASARVLELSRRFSAPVLLAYGQASRDNQEFEDALTFFQAGLQTKSGKDEFRQRFATLVAQVDAQWELTYRDSFVLRTGRAAQAEGRELGTGFFGAQMGSFSDDFTTGTQSFLLSFEFFGQKPPIKDGESPTPLPTNHLSGFYEAMVKEIALRSATLFPQNPIRFTRQGTSYLIEGILNNDYPHNVSQAMYQLGVTYKAMGDYQLSIRYFQSLLGKTELSVDSLTQTEIRYHIIDMLQVINTEGVGPEAMAIIASDHQYDVSMVGSRAPAAGTNLVRNMTRTLKADGLVKTLDLFRLELTPTVRAHFILGSRNLVNNNREEALTHLGYATVQVLSGLIKSIRENDYFFEFKDLSGLMARAGADPMLGRYLEQQNAFEILFYLALALEGEPNGRTLARPILQALSGTSLAGTWQSRARARLGSS